MRDRPPEEDVTWLLPGFIPNLEYSGRKKPAEVSGIFALSGTMAKIRGFQKENEKNAVARKTGSGLRLWLWLWLWLAGSHISYTWERLRREGYENGLTCPKQNQLFLRQHVVSTHFQHLQVPVMSRWQSLNAWYSVIIFPFTVTEPQFVPESTPIPHLSIFSAFTNNLSCFAQYSHASSAKCLNALPVFPHV